jgi:hypothetical protein
VCAGGLVATKLTTTRSCFVLPNNQHTLKMGKELVTETLENFYILTRLSVLENFSQVTAKASRLLSAGLLLH